MSLEISLKKAIMGDVGDRIAHKEKRKKEKRESVDKKD